MFNKPLFCGIELYVRRILWTALHHNVRRDADAVDESSARSCIFRNRKFQSVFMHQGQYRLHRTFAIRLCSHNGCRSRILEGTRKDFGCTRTVLINENDDRIFPLSQMRAVDLLVSVAIHDGDGRPCRRRSL